MTASLAEIRLWDEPGATVDDRAKLLVGGTRYHYLAELMRKASFTDLIPVLPWSEVDRVYDSELRPRLGSMARTWDALIDAWRLNAGTNASRAEMIGK